MIESFANMYLDCTQFTSLYVHSAFAYGLGHLITFDGVKYSFPGNGYFVLTSLKSPVHDLMVQVRMELPEKTFCESLI